MAEFRNNFIEKSHASFIDQNGNEVPHHLRNSGALRNGIEHRTFLVRRYRRRLPNFPQCFVLADQ